MAESYTLDTAVVEPSISSSRRKPGSHAYLPPASSWTPASARGVYPSLPHHSAYLHQDSGPKGLAKRHLTRLSPRSQAPSLSLRGGWMGGKTPSQWTAERGHRTGSMIVGAIHEAIPETLGVGESVRPVADPVCVLESGSGVEGCSRTDGAGLLLHLLQFGMASRIARSYPPSDPFPGTARNVSMGMRL